MLSDILPYICDMHVPNCLVHLYFLSVAREKVIIVSRLPLSSYRYCTLWGCYLWPLKQVLVGNQLHFYFYINTGLPIVANTLQKQVGCFNHRACIVTLVAVKPKDQSDHNCQIFIAAEVGVTITMAVCGKNVSVVKKGVVPSGTT